MSERDEQEQKLRDYERYLHDVLLELRLSYEKAAEPYIRKLVELRAIQPPKIYLTQDQLNMVMSLPDASAPSSPLIERK